MTTNVPTDIAFFSKGNGRPAGSMKRQGQSRAALGPGEECAQVLEGRNAGTAKPTLHSTVCQAVSASHNASAPPGRSLLGLLAPGLLSLLAS